MSLLPVVLMLLLQTVPLSPARAASDQDRAREAVQSGEAQPLGAILAQLRRRYPGRVLDADLNRQGGRLVYEIRLLDRGGRVTEVSVDARSGEVLQARGAEAEPQRGGSDRGPGRRRGRGRGIGFDRD